MRSWQREEVLVVARHVIFPDGAWHGFIDRNLEGYLTVIADRFEFRPRGDVEDDPAWQQIIPYVVFRHEQRYLLTRRLRQSS